MVTTSISVKPRPSPGTPPRVKRPVSLPRGGQVCSVVPRRQRTRVVLCDLVALVYDRNDKDAVGYSLHTSTCGWPGVITKWKLLGKLGFLLLWLACMIGPLGNVIPKNVSDLNFRRLPLIVSVLSWFFAITCRHHLCPTHTDITISIFRFTVTPIPTSIIPAIPVLFHPKVHVQHSVMLPVATQHYNHPPAFPAIDF